MTLRENLERHVRILAGEIGERNVFKPEALDKARDYISGYWRELGYEVTPQVYTAKGVECANLEVSIPGVKHPEKILVIGAHYDSIAGGPGANDNGSGVAAILEIARMLKNFKPKFTIRFVAFVNEEPPFFHSSNRGSRVYVKAAQERNDDIIGMWSLETIGCYMGKPGTQNYPSIIARFFPDTGNFIGFVSNLRSRGWMKKSVEAFKSSSRFPVESLAIFTPLAPGAAWSDHSSFWEAGYKAVMVTDTAFYRYPYYHTPHDTPDKLNYDGFTEVTEGLANALITLSAG